MCGLSAFCQSTSPFSGLEALFEDGPRAPHHALYDILFVGGLDKSWGSRETFTVLTYSPLITDRPPRERKEREREYVTVTAL